MNQSINQLASTKEFNPPPMMVLTAGKYQKT